MPDYFPISNMTKSVKKRTLAGLERLRDQLDLEMPEKTRDATLVLGTWNIRNFDSNGFMNGHRTDEDLYYIAEICTRFDVLAIQEVCEDLAPLDKLMAILGEDYDYIITDVTEGRGGNGERLGFIFDKHKVKFKGVAGELVLKENLLIIDGGKKRQFSRTPFMCSFKSGWFKFMFSTVHIYFGEESGPKYRRRVEEVDKVAKFLAERAETNDENHILVGDFNIVAPGSDGDNALHQHGFKTVENNKGSNKDQTKFYDQISFKVREDELQLVGSDNLNRVFQFFNSIFRKEDFKSYKSALKKTIEEKVVKFHADIEESKLKISRARTENSKANHREDIEGKKIDIEKWRGKLDDDDALSSYYLNEWRTFHASDHLPLWVELKIDFSAEYLKGLADNGHN